MILLASAACLQLSGCGGREPLRISSSNTPIESLDGSETVAPQGTVYYGEQSPAPTQPVQAQAQAPQAQVATVPPPPPAETKKNRKGGFFSRLPFIGGKDDEPEVAINPNVDMASEAELAAMPVTAGSPPTEEEDRARSLLDRAVDTIPFVGEGGAGQSPNVPNLAQESPETVVVTATENRKKLMRQLDLQVVFEPQSISLSSDRRLKISAFLVNKGKEQAVLGFNTTQHIEILIRDASGQIITRWSDDFVFNQTLTSLSVNPGERVEYSETISTRDMRPGQEYTLEVQMVGYEPLTWRQGLRPG